MIRRHLLLATSIGLIAVLALVACNGDDDNGNDVANGNGQTVSMELGDFYFDPDELEGSTGEEITLELENPSSQPHTFTILDGSPRGAGFDDWPNGEVDIELAAGESDSITFTLPDEAGEYEFICTVPGHYEAGQWGTLTVN
jgi:uncharacterized cupredoxin-like copper-binding protein